MRLFLAFRVFFRTLFSVAVADRVAEVLAGGALDQTSLTFDAPPGEEKAKEKKPASPARSDAITLLAALQREARLIDIVREPLGDYSDAQIGAAARDVLRDCGQTLERMFALEPVVAEEEGAELEVPVGFDNGRYRLTGNVTGEPPFRGRLVHHGWQAAKCDLPSWSGSSASASVVSPAEVEL